MMQSSRRKLVAGLALMAALVGCGGAASPAMSTTTPRMSASPRERWSPPVVANAALDSGEARREGNLPASGGSLRRTMEAHFEDALLIREAVIAGTLEAAVEPAYVLSHSRELDGLPEGWQAFVQQMQLDAGRIDESTGATQAAEATADLGVSCGACHQQHGGPKVSDEPMPTQDMSIESRMQRHAWATERLWEGLYVPSSAAWDAGAKALGIEPFPKEVLSRGGAHARSAADDFTRLVVKAPLKRTSVERASLYAQLLVTCGNCHRAVRATIAQP